MEHQLLTTLREAQQFLGSYAMSIRGFGEVLMSQPLEMDCYLGETEARTLQHNLYQQCLAEAHKALEARLNLLEAIQLARRLSGARHRNDDLVRLSELVLAGTARLQLMVNVATGIAKLGNDKISEFITEFLQEREPLLEYLCVTFSDALADYMLRFVNDYWVILRLKRDPDAPPSEPDRPFAMLYRVEHVNEVTAEILTEGMFPC